jgi:phosphotransferase system IIB component
MDDLLGVLESEEKGYRELIALAQDKRQIIIDADITRLEEITEKEQVIADMLHNQELKRVAVLSDMAVVLGQNAEELTVEKMIDILSRQPEEQEKLMDCRMRLRAALDEMKKWNEQNQVLLQNALEMVEFDLTLFKSLRQAPETANYDSNAYNTGTLLGSSGFDAKQ